MAPTVRLFGPNREEIRDLDSWRVNAPPEKGDAQWKDGYSAKEQAKAWTRTGSPAVPEELWAALRPLAGDGDEIYGRPEHRTALDRFSRRRQHDLFACVRRGDTTVLVVGVEAKACEGFDGTVADRGSAAPPSRKRARCNLLARALFGRDVVNEESGEVVDESLGRHGYQLWTAAVGTIIEAQERGHDRAVLVVHQFEPRNAATAKATGDARNWPTALERNAAAVAEFVDAVQAGGAASHETEFVKAGTTLEVVKVRTVIDL